MRDAALVFVRASRQLAQALARKPRNPHTQKKGRRARRHRANRPAHLRGNQGRNSIEVSAIQNVAHARVDVGALEAIPHTHAAAIYGTFFG